MTAQLQRWLAQLKAKMWNDRYVAIMNLEAHAGDPVVQDALLPLLNDIDYRVRRLAARTLAPCAREEKIRAAFEQLCNDSDPKLRKLAAEVLAEKPY